MSRRLILAFAAVALLGGAFYLYATASDDLWLALASKQVPVLTLILWLSSAPATPSPRPSSTTSATGTSTSPMDMVVRNAVTQVLLMIRISRSA